MKFLNELISLKMKFICLLLILSTIAVGRGQNEIEGRIVTGNDVSISNYKYIVSVELWNNNNCAGAILDKTHVVSTASCFPGKNPLLRMRAGSSVSGSGGQEVEIKNIKKHPKYNETTKAFDIAIITVSEPFQFNDKVGKIKLTEKNPGVGSKASFVGWGKNSEGKYQKNLKKIDLNTVEKKKCDDAYKKKFGQNIICAACNKEKKVCDADKGGPLILNNELIGLLSTGDTCGDNPTVHSNVFQYRDFIKSNLA